ncbi:type IVB secretion system protein DotA [Legionella worsleiensis]|uniref:DotA n=1 Tax=Legionella worsleiensis TaxID=45076 RepID=A0A0W1AF93_9GAMM|nr:type IVB secretion system protein DotA [Legionella worsleiensis]KTD79999.1 DotA [Legionella worsleiensis]STY32471.1 DotA [Legionella worsleiensis]
MNKLVLTVLLFLFPALLFADESGSLSFAPPATDYSVIFLGNLFGVVDGVLHGTGSQIMGTMFGVFNAAVLALGGIIITYTLLVSTMNTAHEGQMLGQKWSSIWIPLRSTMGLALLIPKASGYCMMQIFVMWVIVQGIGAADKVWEAALGYLNRGGVIIQAQANPADALTASSTGGVSDGALTILAGQVCMLGLQNKLEAQRQSYLQSQANDVGPCAGNPSEVMDNFCKTAVPDFLGTVNAVITQNNNPSANSFSLPMPNFDSTSPFNFLNGICGTITWNSLNSTIDPNQTMTKTNKKGNTNEIPNLYQQLTPSQLETAQMSRAIAIQQMYITLSSIAQIIINNDPDFSNTNTGTTTTNFSPIAKQQFGVPFTAQGQICSDYSQVCVIWGPVPTPTGTNSSVLFNGTEFLGAISDYNAVMMPTLNLINQANNNSNSNTSRDFITQAANQGWIMAGSYFFDLVQLNGNAVTSANQFDTNTGLNTSTFDPTNLVSSFTSNNSCSGQYSLLCTWFQGDKTPLDKVQSIINGASLDDMVSKPSMKDDAKRPVVGNQQSSTVYGFINNSVMVQLPGQPGIAQPQFANMIDFSISTEQYYLPKGDFDCGRVRILFFTFCLGRMFGDLFYNVIFRNLYNTLLKMFSQIINQVIMAFLMVPLQGMSLIFKAGLNTVSQPGVNPIVALANMGVMYINFSANLWLMLIDIAVSSSLIFPFGLFIYALIGLSLPLLMAWVGTMVAVGFVTAYYIPVLPYMIFTFGSIAWLIAVIEAMVAAPIVALGVTHPEGHDAFGKGEAAIMILMNVFLRPSMMIIGYISAIALSYVGVWILNAGFDHAISFIQTGSYTLDTSGSNFGGFEMAKNAPPQQASGTGGYTDWAGVYAYFFSILIYTTMYLIMVQKAFSLIAYLPDKVLRWISGSPESLGQDAAGWGEELKAGVKAGAEQTQGAQSQMGQKMGAIAGKRVGEMGSSIKSALQSGGEASASGSKSGEDGGSSSKSPGGGVGAE